jgi:hypothetical protein
VDIFTNDVLLVIFKFNFKKRMRFEVKMEKKNEYRLTAQVKIHG